MSVYFVLFDSLLFISLEIEVEEAAGERSPLWDGHEGRAREMTWHNDAEEVQKAIQTVPSSSSENPPTCARGGEKRTITCPSCGHTIELQDQTGIQDLPGLPAGVKFDPSDQEILEHLEAKLSSDAGKLHPLIDEFIATLEGENGICYTHPERLPGVSKDGLIRHFFHRPSKAYTTGTRKRRKVHTDEEGGETRWHKTGKTRPIVVGGAVRGFKKILVLYTNYGRQRKPEKTNWVMHQYHLGNNEEEKDGELVVSKVFYQTQPRQCNSSVKDSSRSQSGFESPLIRNTATYMDYYNPALISYPGPSQIIPNLVLQGDGSSFLHHLPTTASKGKVLERK